MTNDTLRPSAGSVQESHAASLALLEQMRNQGGEILTAGLSDAVISKFLGRDPALTAAIEQAGEEWERLRRECPELLSLDEKKQISVIQADFVNFYPDDAVNPYVSIGGAGPWIVTTKGAVIHDNGGYGMIGLGHAPTVVLEAMNQPHLMANVMTANFSQLRLATALKAEIGRTRGGCPYTGFLCLNSGSESVSMASRIVDTNAKLMTDPGARHEGKSIQRVVLRGSFHGRTDRPAQYSDSTRRTYAQHLATFRDGKAPLTVAANDEAELREAFAQADRDGLFIEAMFIEPVMGEGDPGMSITPGFYSLARELTSEHGSLLLVDSIQAGLRSHGCLSAVDYPGFSKLPAPDMETFSKALNAGQYPLSVLAVTDSTAALYKKGVYGNTMTTNPRAMDVGYAVLESLTDQMRRNIVERGEEFLTKFEALREELGGSITKVQGTGLLFSVELDPRFKVWGVGSVEEHMRQAGVGVIHGGENSLRFTPHFAVTTEEVDLIVASTKAALLSCGK